MKVQWTDESKRALKEIGRYIAVDNRVAARKWVQRLRERGKKAGTAPWTGRKVPELNLDDHREVLVRNYRIVYRIEAKQIVILTVFEGHMLLENALGRK